MKTLFINVINADIAAGKKDDCRLCPIALAIKRLLNKDIYVLVTPVYAEFYIGDKWVDISYLPPNARNFIDSFDKGDLVQPFGFEIQINSVYAKLLFKDSK